MDTTGSESGRRAKGVHVTVTESIFVRAVPEVVFDATQDWTRRTAWDASVLEADVIERADAGARRGPVVHVRGQGGLEAVFRYKRYERPHGTSLAMEDVRSAWIEGGGGAWTYAAREGGTLWTQTNTLVLKPGPLRALVALLVRTGLRSSTRKALAKAKVFVERGA
jgi:hypothetical protein